MSPRGTAARAWVERRTHRRGATRRADRRPTKVLWWAYKRHSCSRARNRRAGALSPAHAWAQRGAGAPRCGAALGDAAPKLWVRGVAQAVLLAWTSARGGVCAARVGRGAAHARPIGRPDRRGHLRCGFCPPTVPGVRAPSRARAYLLPCGSISIRGSLYPVPLSFYDREGARGGSVAVRGRYALLAGLSATMILHAHGKQAVSGH